MKRGVFVLAMGILILVVSGAFAQTKIGEWDKLAPGTKNAFGWTVPKETLEITFYAGQADPETAAKATVHFDQFLEAQFNVKLHKIVYATDMKERLNLMLASNDYPEAIINLSPDDAQLFIGQNKAIELTGLVDRYGPNIKSQLGPLYKRYLVNGKLYVVPKSWGLLPIPDYSASIRLDYWKEIGQPKFETTDEFYNVLKAIVAKHPSNDKGEKVYAMSDWGQGGRLLPCLTGAFGFKAQFAEDASHNVTHWMNTTEGLEMVKYFNRYFREGLLDPDFAINQFNDWQVKYTANRIIGYIGSWWPTWSAGHMIWQKTVPNWSFDMRGVNVSIKAPFVKGTPTITPKDLSGYWRSIITDKCRNPERIITWWNWEISDIGTKVIGWGIPNSSYSDWDLMPDGSSRWHDKVISDWEASNFDLSPYDKGEVGGQYWMVAGQQKLSKADPRVGEWCNIWFDQNFNALDKGKKLMMENLKGTIFDNSARAVTFAPDNPVTIKNQQVTDLINSGWPKMVTAKTVQECEALFLELRDKLNKAGLKDVEKFRSEEYKKRLDAWK